MERKFLINIVTGQGGGGHYATYHAIRAIAEQQQRPWQFQVTDMDDMITTLTQQNQLKNTYKLFGVSAHDLYNWMVKSGWTWLWFVLMQINKRLVKINYRDGVRLFKQHWQEHQPDLVVTVMPLFNKVIWESIQQAQPGTPVVTILTDFADCPPGFWLEPETNNYVVCGTEQAVVQAQAMGVSRVINTSGLVIHPRFYQPLGDPSSTPNEAVEIRRNRRQQLGLDPDRLTGLVMFGGNGSQVMLDIAKRLEKFQDQLQLIFLCGRNRSLADSLHQYRGAQRRLITTFTDDVPTYMHLADFFIGKPGNVSVSEAMAMKLPIITECNAFTMAQERYCAKWVTEQQVGIVIPSFRNVDRAVATLIQPDTYARYRANLCSLNNQAVFEVVELLAHLLEPGTVDMPMVAHPSVL